MIFEKVDNYIFIDDEINLMMLQLCNNSSEFIKFKNDFYSNLENHANLVENEIILKNSAEYILNNNTYQLIRPTFIYGWYEDTRLVYFKLKNEPIFGVVDRRGSRNKYEYLWRIQILNIDLFDKDLKNLQKNLIKVEIKKFYFKFSNLKSLIEKLFKDYCLILSYKEIFKLQKFNIELVENCVLCFIKEYLDLLFSMLNNKIEYNDLKFLWFNGKFLEFEIKEFHVDWFKDSIDNNCILYNLYLYKKIYILIEILDNLLKEILVNLNNVEMNISWNTISWNNIKEEEARNLFKKLENLSKN